MFTETPTGFTPDATRDACRCSSSVCAKDADSAIVPSDEVQVVDAARLPRTVPTPGRFRGFASCSGWTRAWTCSREPQMPARGPVANHPRSQGAAAAMIGGRDFGLAPSDAGQSGHQPLYALSGGTGKGKHLRRGHAGARRPDRDRRRGPWTR